MNFLINCLLDYQSDRNYSRIIFLVDELVIAMGTTTSGLRNRRSQRPFSPAHLFVAGDFSG